MPSRPVRVVLIRRESFHAGERSDLPQQRLERLQRQGRRYINECLDQRIGGFLIVPQGQCLADVGQAIQAAHQVDRQAERQRGDAEDDLDTHAQADLDPIPERVAVHSLVAGREVFHAADQVLDPGLVQRVEQVAFDGKVTDLGRLPGEQLGRIPLFVPRGPGNAIVLPARLLQQRLECGCARQFAPGFAIEGLRRVEQQGSGRIVAADNQHLVDAHAVTGPVRAAEHQVVGLDPVTIEQRAALCRRVFEQVLDAPVAGLPGAAPGVEKISAQTRHVGLQFHPCAFPLDPGRAQRGLVRPQQFPFQQRPVLTWRVDVVDDGSHLGIRQAQRGACRADDFGLEIHRFAQACDP